MARKEINELLTQTGPGTPMGEMFRQYWIPALLAEELPENDCPPVRVKLLSERLIAFRDSDGRMGLIDEFCAHRGVSLWFGRNEEGGLRCPYHGWKYDVTGQCIEVPSEPVESGYCQKVKLTGYPLVKIGDILWTHMGDKAQRPPMPEWEFALVPSGADLHLEALAGMQLAAGDGRRHRFEPRFLAPFRRAQERSPVQGRQGQRLQPARQDAVLRGDRGRGRIVHRRAAKRRGGPLLLADHAVGDAELHHGAAARRPSGARPFLDSDRRRELLGVELRLSPGQGADGPSARR